MGGKRAREKGGINPDQNAVAVASARARLTNPAPQRRGIVPRPGDGRRWGRGRGAAAKRPARTRHLVRKFGILDAQNTRGAAPPPPFFACDRLIPRVLWRASSCLFPLKSFELPSLRGERRHRRHRRGHGERPHCVQHEHQASQQPTKRERDRERRRRRKVYSELTQWTRRTPSATALPRYV